MEIMPDRLKNLRIKLEHQKRLIDEQLKAIGIVERLCDQQATESEPAQLRLAPEPRYKDFTIKQAILHILGLSDREGRAREITEEMTAGGYKFSTRKPVPSVSTTLKRLAKEGQIEQVRVSLKGNTYRRRATENL
jgi:hypothetical protein